jgi:hypothetical protein
MNFMQSLSNYFNPSLSIPQIYHGLCTFISQFETDTDERLKFARSLLSGTIGLEQAHKDLQTIHAKIVQREDPAIVATCQAAIALFNKLSDKPFVPVPEDVRDEELPTLQVAQEELPPVPYLRTGEERKGTIAFISPNEFSPACYEEVLKKAEGTLLSVGTFRALIDFTNGSFDYAVLFDIGETICTFNCLHLDFIAAIGSIKDLSPAGQRMLYRFVLRDYDDNREKFWSLPDEIQQKMQDIWDIGFAETEKREWLSNVFHELSRYKSSSSSFAYFWEDDEKWLSLLSAIQEERIIIVSGDLLGDHVLSRVGQMLSVIDQKVSIIDISNIPTYKPDAEKLMKNLKQLPLADHASLLFTTGLQDAHAPTCVGVADWSYHALPMERLEEIKEICNK